MFKNEVEDLLVFLKNHTDIEEFEKHRTGGLRVYFNFILTVNVTVDNNFCCNIYYSRANYIWISVLLHV
jgi:hypothetical protein